MLSKFDDYPIHQTSEPIAHPASGDRNTYGRYWFNGYAADGEFYFGIAAALYPNLGIMDCAFSLVRDGVQYSFVIELGGVRRTIALEPILCFQMKGIGYTHTEWGHGMWKGELAVAIRRRECAPRRPAIVLGDVGVTTTVVPPMFTITPSAGT